MRLVWGSTFTKSKNCKLRIVNYEHWLFVYGYFYWKNQNWWNIVYTIWTKVHTSQGPILNVLCIGWCVTSCKNNESKSNGIQKWLKNVPNEKCCWLILAKKFGWGIIEPSAPHPNSTGSLTISSSHQYLTNVQCCYRRFGRETIHPTQKFTPMNLLQMPCVIT